MSHPNASVQTVGSQTYLVINEVDGTSGSVPVKLAKQDTVVSSNPTVYGGTIIYNNNGTDTDIDVIEVHFSNSTTNENNVSLEVTLNDSGNYYTSSTPVSAKSGSLHYVASQTTSGGSVAGQPNVVTLSYSLPPQNTNVTDGLNFATHLGMIDPQEMIERDPH